MTAIHSINAVDLKERVAINEAFTPAERDFMLGAISAKIGPAGSAMVVTVEAPRNYLGKIDTIWIVLSVDDGGEGVVAAPIGPGGMPLPLIAADAQRLESIVPLARSLAVRLGKVMRLAKFTTREDHQVFQP